MNPPFGIASDPVEESANHLGWDELFFATDEPGPQRQRRLYVRLRLVTTRIHSGSIVHDALFFRQLRDSTTTKGHGFTPADSACMALDDSQTDELIEYYALLGL